MHDRGEKIVNLAREMLESERNLELHRPPAPQNLSNQIKAVCLAAFIAAFGSQFVTHAIDENRRPLNRYEKVELEALIFYASRAKALDHEALRLDLLNKIARTSIEDMSRADFNQAREYLQSRLQ